MEQSEISLEKRLYNAAAEGDPSVLRGLLQHDPFLLDTVSFTCPNKTPLHIATMKGHQPFVEEILNHNPQLAELLDLQQTSPLHVASARGYLGIVQKLLLAAPRMSLSLDSQGRSPLHYAALEGHGKVATELVQSAMSTMQSLAKNEQLNALNMLMPSLNYLTDARDEDGNTMLHMAVRDKRIEIIEYLVDHTGIDVKAKNKDKQTAWDILQEQDQNQPHDYKHLNKEIKRRLCNSYKSQTQSEKWLSENRDAVMVVAVLIATMAFQAGVSPPGGVWQENNALSGNSTVSPAPTPAQSYRAGEAVMAFKNHDGAYNELLAEAYKSFIRCNTVAFASSLSTIMLLISGLPFKRPVFMWFLMAIMWLTITSIAATYAISIHVITPENHATTFAHVLRTGISVWTGVMAVLLVGNTIQLIDKWLKNRGIDTLHLLDKWLKAKGLTWRPGKSNDSGHVKNVNGNGNA